MSYNNPNQPRQPPMQHPGMPPGSGPGQQSMMRRPPMMPQKILITEANLVENVARLPEQVQQKINSLPSLEEKVRTTQTWIENAIMRRFQQQQQQAPNPQQMNMQQSQRQLGSGPGQGMPGQHMAQQRMNMQRMPTMQRTGSDSMMYPRQPPMQQQSQRFQQPPQQQQQQFQPKMEVGMSQPGPGQFQPKIEPGVMPQHPNFQPKTESPNFPPNFQLKQEPGVQPPPQQQQPSGGFMGQPGQGQFQPSSQQQGNIPFPGPGPESNERMQQPTQQFQRPNIQQQPQKAVNIPFPGPGPEANEQHQRMLLQQRQQQQQQAFQNQPPPQQSQQPSQRMLPPQNQGMPNQPPPIQLPQRDGQMQNFQPGQMPMRGPQQSGGLFGTGPPGQQQMTNFPGSGPQQQSQQQSFPGQPPQQQGTAFPGQQPQQQGTGFPGQPPQQQGNTFAGQPPQQGSTFPGQSGQPSGPFPGQPSQQGFYQQGNQPPPQMFSQQQQQRPQIPQQFQSQPTPPQQQPGPQPASQQTQPGSLLQPPSQGQPQGPGSHQPPSYQGPSPAVQAVTSVGRAPTPSGRSNQSSTTVSQEVFNSPDYQAALKELCSYKETCFRLVDRVKLDGAEHLSANFTKVLQIIEGKIQVPKELLLKLIRNVQSLEGKYNVTNGLTEAMAILQKQPEIDISTFTLIHEKYGRFSSEYITAPKKLYSIIERKKRFKNETLYLKRRMKWIDQNGIDWTEPLKHPFSTVPKQYLRSKIYKKQFEDDGNVKPKDEEGEKEEPEQEIEKKSVKFDDTRKYIDENGFISCIVKVEDETIDIGNKTDFYDELDIREEGNKYETLLPEEGITSSMYCQHGVYMHPIVHDHGHFALLGEGINDEVEKLSHKRQLEEENNDEPPNKKQKKNDDEEKNGEFEENLEGISKRKIITSKNVQGLTSNDLAMNEAYFSYIKRQQETNIDEAESMNAKLVREDEKFMEEILPIDYPTNQPIMDKQHYTSDECMFNCCVPYPLNTLIGKAARLPQAAATELRRFRHRPDNEFVPLSEHAQVYSVIINPSKYNGPRYPEIRIFIHKDYPRKSADYLIMIPSVIQSNAIKSFYRKLEEKMEDRRLSGQPLKTITQIISAFRIACDMVFKNRDILDFSEN